MESVTRLLRHTEFWLALAALAAVLLAGAGAVSLVRRWRAQQGRDSPSPEEQLESYRRLHEQGELSREEYDRIRSQLQPPIDSPPDR